MNVGSYLVRHNRIGLLGALILLGFTLVALFPSFFAPHDPLEMYAEARLVPPTFEFPMGTDRFGRDIMSRIAYGARISFVVGVMAVLVATVIGSLLGTLAGYFRGGLDYGIMRVMDTIFAFPSLLLAIAIAAVAGSGLSTIIVAIGIIYIPIFARVARAPVLSVKEQEYVTAAVAIGVPTSRILRRHVFPNITTPITVQMALAFSGAIVVEAALSFLGLGAVPPTPSLGSMLSEGRAFMELAPWTVIFPGLALALAIMGINLFGDALRDMLDVRQRGDA